MRRELSAFVEKELKCLQDENAEEAIDKVRNSDETVAKLVDSWARAFTEVRILLRADSIILKE